MATRKSTAAKARERLRVAGERAEAEVEAVGEGGPQRSGAAYSEVPLASVAQNLANVRDDLGDLTDLVASIREQGVLQALVVRPLAEGEHELYPNGTRYVAVMGNRRRAAGERAGLQTLPVVVRTDITTVNQRRSMLVENLQRKDLTPLEEARAFQQELDGGLSQRGLAKAIGVTQAHVSRRIALLKLDPALQTLVDETRIGVDLAVNDLGKLSAEDQHSVGAQLTDQTVGPIEPDLVRRVVASVHHARELAERHATQRQQAEKAGATVLDREAAQKQFGDGMWGRQLHGTKEIAAAAESGELVAVLTPYGPEPQYLTSGKPATADVRREDPEAKARREWKARRQAIDAWVEQHPKPSRSEFVEALQRHLVETMPHESGAVVHRWLQGRVGTEGEYYAWQRSLTEADYPTVAWHLTVAADLMGSRHATDSPAGRRTTKRAKETGHG